MNEKKRKIIVFAALILAIIWGSLNFDWSDKTINTAVTPVQKPNSTRLPNKDILNDSIVEEKTAQNWGNDPFQTKNGKTVSKQGGNWVVTGIIYNETSPLAYINRTPLKIGDSIDNAKVVQIERNGVTLQYNGQDHKIYFSES